MVSILSALWGIRIRGLWKLQSILKEVSTEYSLEGLILKLKLQYCGHLMQRTDLLEKKKKNTKNLTLQERIKASIGNLLLFNRSVVSDSLRPHGWQHARFPCPSPPPGICSVSSPLSPWCHPAILSSVAPFSCLQSFPASGSFPVSLLFASGGQSIGALASVLPMNIQGWFPLGLTGLISLLSK